MLQWLISSSVLILVVIGLRFVLRGKLRPMVQYGLWALVLVRLLLPFQFGSTAISFQNTVEKAPVVQEMHLAEQVDRFVYHEDGSATAYFEQAPVVNFQPIPSESITFTPQEAQKLTKLRTVNDWLNLIWIVGMVGMTVTFFLSNAHFARKLRKNRRFLEKKTLSIYETKEVKTPCLFGLSVYLTPEAAADPRLRYYTITHETTHHRHLDMVWSLLRCLCLILHWYNPLVWWAAVLSRADGELACDEATIASIGEDHRADYGRALIDLTCIRPSDLLQTATMMTGSARGLRERITLIAKKPKMAVYTLLIVVLIAAVAVGCTFTGGEEQPESTPPAEAELNPDSLIDPEDPKYYGIAAGLHGGFYASPTRMHIVSFLSAPIFTDVCVEADETQAPKQVSLLQGSGALRKIKTTDLNALLTEHFGITIAECESFAKSGMYYDAAEDVYYFREVSFLTGTITVEGVLLDDDGVTQHAVYKTEECWVSVTLKQTETGCIITSCEKAPNNILAEPTPSTKPTEPTPESILGWKLPNYPQLSYEEYFSQTRYYYYADQGEDPQQNYFWGGWNNGTDKCEVWMEDGKILAGSSLSGKYVQVGTETYENTRVVCCDEFWIYAIKDRKELFRMDYKGENRQTLYRDETEKIMASEHNTHVRENSVLFFTAAAGSDYGIYRLYLPDMTLDLLYTTDVRPDLYSPYSNFEITWSSPVKKVVDRVAEIDYYYNCTTGKLLEKPVYGDRSWGNITWPWWEDVLAAELYELPGTAYDKGYLEWLENLFTGSRKTDYNWYNLLLFAGHTFIDMNDGFTNPAEIELSILFNNGFYLFHDVEITKEEDAFLDADIFYPNYPYSEVVKLPVELMNQVLLDYTGYTLDETNGRGLDSMLYYEPTDCYFFDPRGAATANAVKMICGSEEEDGTVHLICTADGAYMYLKLLPKDGDPDIPYYVYSCYEITPRT